MPCSGHCVPSAPKLVGGGNVRITRSTFYGYLFFAPFLVLFIIFRIYPLGHSVWLTFHEWGVFTDPEFIGLDNFRELVNTPRFWRSLQNTIYFTVLTVPPLMVLGFIAALVVNSDIYGRGFFRFFFYLPHILSVSVVCLVWILILMRDFGLLNAVLSTIGLPKIPWLGSPRFAMPAIALTTIWWTFGFNFLIYLSSLQSIPPSLYESAQIDGAGPLQRLGKITIPILKRTHGLVAVLQMISSLQIFAQVYIMTGGGPGGSTRVIIQYIYDEGFRHFNMGYAQAAAFAFFLMMVGIAYIQVKLMLQKKGDD